MRRNKIQEEDLKSVANKLSLPLSEVRRAVHSFFGSIVQEVRGLPFDNERKIFTKDSFAHFGSVYNIPSIGRIGPVYSRYLLWRGNEAKNFEQVSRSSYRSIVTQDEIEHIADVILSGGTPSPVQKKKRSELYTRIWMVSPDGKKSARQVIPKQNV